VLVAMANCEAHELRPRARRHLVARGDPHRLYFVSGYRGVGRRKRIESEDPRLLRQRVASCTLGGMIT
jgi:hypothetical protein